MEEQRKEGILTSRGTAVDADVCDVVPGEFCCRGLMPKDAVRKSCVGDILPCNVVERLGAIKGSHAVDLHDDEAHVCHGLHADDLISARLKAEGPERLGDKRTVWAGIDVLDHRVFLVRIEVPRLDDQSPDVS